MKNRDRRQQIGIKYCGGCNPDYDRLSFAEKLIELFEGEHTFVFQDFEDAEVILVIHGCATACADVTLINRCRKVIHIIDGRDLMMITKEVRSELDKVYRI